MLNWGFWAVTFALTLAVTLLLVRALTKGQKAGDDAAALKVYRDQLAEVDRDLARGVLTPAEAERLKTEVSRRLLDADRALRAAPAAASDSNLPVAALAILAAIFAAVLGYLWLGAPNYPDMPIKQRMALAEQDYLHRPDQATAEAQATETPATDVDAEFLDLMTKLRAAIEARPDDQTGLDLLAKNEAKLGNFKAARKAMEHLVALKGNQATPADHLQLAQLQIMAAGGYVSPEAEQQLMLTLQGDPTNPLARYYTGLMFAQNQRPDRTFALWEPLLREGPDTAPWIEPIRANLPQLAEAAGIRYQPPAPAAPMAGLKGPSAGDVAAAGEMSDQDRQAMIAGMVDKLQTRLAQEGGEPEEWAQLINALSVLGKMDEARAALNAANTAYAGDSTALATLAEAASVAGVTP